MHFARHSCLREDHQPLTLGIYLAPCTFFFFFLMHENITWKTCLCVNTMFPSYLSFSFAGSLQRPWPYTSSFSEAIWICIWLHSQVFTQKLGAAMVERQSQHQMFQTTELVPARHSESNCYVNVNNYKVCMLAIIYITLPTPKSQI